MQGRQTQLFKKSLAYPHLLWMTLFVIVPIVLVLIYSVTVVAIDGTTHIGLDNYIKFFDITYMKIFATSLWIALLSTVFCLALGYPAAMILANKDRLRIQQGKKTTGMLMLFVMPMWMNMMLRTYSWLTILEKNGLLNMILRALNLPDANGIVNTILGLFGIGTVKIIYTNFAVILGMVYNFVPFMILPIYSVLIKIDESIIEAAQDLGANSARIFFKIILPMSVPGIISGITMVFLPSVTTFYISNIFGGGEIMLIGNVIEQRFLTGGDWNFGSAISIIMMVLIFISMKIMDLFNKDGQSSATL